MNGRDWLEDVRFTFSKQRGLLERALEQVSDDDFFRMPDQESNSCAVMVKHLAGNMRSRWTDFLTADGEKPDRMRDGEFEIHDDEDRPALERALADGWQRLESALDSLDAEDLDRIVLIRSVKHTVVQAVHRQVAHYAYHIGQIVYVARMWAGPKWKSLSIAKGQSQAHDRMQGNIRDEN